MKDCVAERKALIEYLKVKVAAEDWHAVSDAANDLRVLEASQPDQKFFVGKGIQLEHTIINGEPYTRVFRKT